MGPNHTQSLAGGATSSLGGGPTPSLAGGGTLKLGGRTSWLFAEEKNGRRELEYVLVNTTGVPL